MPCRPSAFTRSWSILMAGIFERASNAAARNPGGRTRGPRRNMHASKYAPMSSCGSFAGAPPPRNHLRSSSGSVGHFFSFAYWRGIDCTSCLPSGGSS